MKLARIIGTVVSTVKNESIRGKKILILKNLNTSRETYGTAFLALDSIGAGMGEDIFYIHGKEAAFPFLPSDIPVDSSIVAIVDKIYKPQL